MQQNSQNGDIWIGTGIWAGWRLTTDHVGSSYGQPVLIAPDGRTFGPGDISGNFASADLARALGVSRAAIKGRIDRGTLPAYDGHDDNGRGYWHYDTIRHLLTVKP